MTHFIPPPRPRKDVSGIRFGRLIALSFVGKNKYGKSVYECHCDCGVIASIERASLVNGTTKSCGCLRRESITKHGKSGTPEYQAFLNAKYRCTNPKLPKYSDYGGRGIRFLFATFEEFLAEVGNRPLGTTLDRRDNDGNYEKGNVRWVNRSTQTKNQHRFALPRFSPKQIQKIKDAGLWPGGGQL